MNNFVFYSPTEFVFGKDTEMQVGALAGKYGARKLMILFGCGSVLRSGLLDRVKQSLQKAGIRYCEMGGVQPNPVDTKDKGRNSARDTSSTFSVMILRNLTFPGITTPAIKAPNKACNPNISVR